MIGKTVKLTKAGREYKGCCPFHNEKTPSFYVNDDKSFYHCFGCSAHGDAIRWMTEQQGLPFIDAVQELAQAAGMEMPAQDRQSVERAERAKGLHDLMADAAQFFTDQLNGIAGAEARALLERRGIKAETSRTFGMGYSPDSRGKLREALKSYGDSALIEAGMLIKVDDKEPYDRFRGRLMIPIRDARGRVIAFGGRVIGQGEPKYLNSPDTPLFDKGRTLYNLDRAAPASRKSGRVIVVEGYMDVIALAQAGFGEAVAPLGTALTEHQLERLWRLSDVPILCFDGDAAGQKAAIRAALRALPGLAPGRSLRFVTLPEGQDPDDLVRARGPSAFETLLEKPEIFGRPAMGARICSRAARHTRATRGPQAPADDPCRGDRRSRRAPRISGRIPPPHRRFVRASEARFHAAPIHSAPAGHQMDTPSPARHRRGQGSACRRDRPLAGQGGLGWPDPPPHRNRTPYGSARQPQTG